MAVKSTPSSQAGAASRHVDALARSVLTSLRSYPGPDTRAQLSRAAHDLASRSTGADPFDTDDVLAGLRAQSLGNPDLMDYCIPEAAMLIGQYWQDDTISFWQVSLSGARLYSLVKRISAEWDMPADVDTRLGVMVVTCGEQTHLLGPALLSDQLRRAGCSVRSTTTDTGQSVVETLDQSGFDLVLFSCSSADVLEPVKQVIRHIRDNACMVPPIVVGGAIMDHAENIREFTGADLVTRDIKTALGLCGCPGAHAELKVAE